MRSLIPAPHRRRLVIALAFAFMVAIGSVRPHGASAFTATASNFQVISQNEDGFRNYDFTDQTVSNTHVDWAVQLIYTNNAEIDKVKDILGNRYDNGGSCADPDQGRLDDGGGFQWDSDSGRKTTCCPGAASQPSTASHYRIYATSNDDRMYNTYWGYYVFGEIHEDHNECSLTGTKWFGYSEGEEGDMGTYWHDLGYTVWKNELGMNNDENRDEGNHYWRSSGKTTKMRVE